jgi:hypothetical protein
MNQINDREPKLGFWGRYLARYRFCRWFRHYNRLRSFVIALRDAWFDPLA